ncbi:hypothetical protein M0R45_037254 [Rubus argutus]|uniref:KIB1-4 beta-propeller domain-containing protein n=1 Tax=Rubus argutus TaxID=59490 RepID=A0AAW1W1X7_RUBAR
MGSIISYQKKRKYDIVTKAADHDWSNLHQDLIIGLAEQIVSMKDFFAFRGVCKSWRSAAIKENCNRGLRLQHIVPVLVLPKNISAPIRNFYSLTKGEIYRLDLPETRGKLCFSSLGWSLTVSLDDSRLHLFNPLNHALIELPQLRAKTLILRNITKFVLSSNPSWTSNYGVMLQSNCFLVFYRPGYNNDKWTRIILPGSVEIFTDTIYYKGRFYVVGYKGGVFVCDMEDPKNAQMMLIAPALPQELFGLIYFKAPYLVESATGALLLVVCSFGYKKSESTLGCRVFKVSFGNGNSWSSESEVKNLGNRTLFLSANSSSFSIEALDDSICKPNCIYFLNRCHVSTRGDIDIGIYYMEDGNIERDLEKLSDFQYKGSSLTSHLWIQPSF